MFGERHGDSGTGGVEEEGTTRQRAARERPNAEGRTSNRRAFLRAVGAAGALGVAGRTFSTPAEARLSPDGDGDGRLRGAIETPDGFVLLQRSEVTLELLDRQIEVAKVLDVERDRTLEVAIDEDGEAVDHRKLLAEERRRFGERYGTIHPTLFERLRTTKGSLPVALWVDIDEEFVDKSRFSTRELDEQPEELVSYRRAVQEAKRRAGELLEKFDVEPLDEREEGRAPETVPVVHFRAEPEVIRELAELDDVAGLFLVEPDGIDDLGDSMAVSNADDVHVIGFDGRGARVAVWEAGPDDFSELSISGLFDAFQSQQSWHARLVTGVIRNRQDEGPDGYAPGARVYSANSYTLDALDWAVVDRRASVVNQSFHRASEPGSPYLSYDDIVKDYLALHYPYPFVAQAAGNFWSTDPDNIDPPSSEYVNHKGYNSVSAGNHNDAASAMAGGSVFRNPDTAHDDRELPEISANGTNVSAVGRTASGTSFASPAVAGAAALLQDASSTLRYWPEGIRAILAASAGRNVSTDADERDGAGALDVAAGVAVARSRRSRNNSPSSRGWNVGSLSPSQFDRNGRSTFSYNVRVPRGDEETRVKVALAWTSKVTSLELFGTRFYFDSSLTTDYDLLVYDSGGTYVAGSSSWDNSYEVVEFTAQPGRTYRVRVRLWSGDDTNWYGIAWTNH